MCSRVSLLYHSTDETRVKLRTFWDNVKGSQMETSHESLVFVVSHTFNNKNDLLYAVI